MKYVICKDNKVLDIVNKEPVSVSKSVIIARCKNIPKINKANGEYYEVFNIQEHTETYTVKEPKEVIKIDEATGEEYPDTEYVEVEKDRTYFTCELTVKQSEKTVKRIRLRKLKNWFNTEYRYYNEKLTRFKALGIFESVTDKVFNLTYASLDDLYMQAEKIRNEINELETEV